ncbi:FG-GAP-like repeat-containing protein [Ekhidna sp.]|uniref:FG-GAP-like repeat-containing protein n=1 Tax=Ekhidna sp. TaxID=2608089 RepID=UPI0032975440
MNNLYSITLQRTKEKYLKFKNRLEKSISSGRFNSLSRKSKNRLVSRVDKYKSKIEEVNLAVKGSLVAGSVLAASVIPQDAIAKDERSEFDRGALSFDNEEPEEILNPIKEAIAKRNTFKIDESVAGLNDLDGDSNNKFFATGGLAVSLVNFTENNANRGDIIGVLVAQDLGGYGLSPDGITFSFATGDGTNDADNAKFEIVNNNQLIVAAATTLDFETQNSFNLFINVDDGDIPADYAITMYMENSPEQGVGTFDKTGEQLSTFRMNNGSTADLDGDGIEELIFTGREDKYSGTRIFVQNIGIGGDPVQVYSTGSIARAADIDGDGDLDLVVGVSNYLRLLQNDGSGNFTYYNSVAYSFGSVYDIEVADFDQNGKVDFAVAGSSNTRVLLDIGSAMSVANSGTVYDLSVGDFDQDGFPDLAFIDGYNAVAIRENVDGSYFSFTTSSYQNSPRKVEFSDIDGDGDDDVIAVGYDIITLTNYGGSFSGSSTVYLSSYLNDKDHIAIVDIDGDGDDDLVVNTYVYSNNFEDSYNEITVHTNVAGVFSTAQSFQSDIDNQGIRTLFAGDIDADDDLDIIISRDIPNNSPSGGDDYQVLVFENRNVAPYISSFNGKLRLEENQSPGTLGSFTFYDPNGESITAAPFDGDNDNDLFSYSDSDLSLVGDVDWEEVGSAVTFQFELGDGYSTRVEDVTFAVNNLAEAGSGTFESEPVPLFGKQRTRHAISGDFDNDGDQDLMKVSFTSGGGGIEVIGPLDSQFPNSMFNQIEDGTFIEEPIYDLSSRLDVPLFIDLDNDGDLDLVGETDGGEGNVIARLINEDGVLDRRDSYGNNFIIDFMQSGDFDNDGITELVILDDYFNSQIMVFDVDDGGEMSQTDSFYTNYSGSYIVTDNIVNLEVGDINGDGFDDLLLTVTNGGDDVMIPGGEFGLNTSLATSVITDPDYGSINSKLVDIDGDGDLDIVLHTVYDDANYYSEIDIHLNDGSGYFTPGGSFLTGGENGGELALGDIDGDGSPDLITISGSNSGGTYTSYLKIWTNDGSGTFTLSQELPFEDGLGDQLSLMDVDGDDDNDIIFEYNKYTVALINANVAPTAIVLSGTSLDEHLAIDSEVATLSATDANALDTHTFSLVEGDGSNDLHNGYFRIDGNSLQIIKDAKFEDTPQLFINLEATDDSGASVTEAFILTVNDVNQAPTAITLSTSSLDENTPAGSAVATIDATDVNASDEHTFSLVAGDGSNDRDNNKFVVEGDQLIIKQASRFETQANYNIYLSASDNEGSVAQAFVLSVIDVNQAPTSISLSITSIDESVSPGSTVALISATDPNAGDSPTFALVEGDGTNDSHNDMFVIVENELILIDEIEFNDLQSININIQADDGEETFEQTFTLVVNEVLGLSDEISNTLGVYPNPGNDRFQINFENNVRGAVTIKVSDLSGKVVHSISSFKDQMEFVHSIDMSTAEAGIYLIELITVREVITQRWIKK